MRKVKGFLLSKQASRAPRDFRQHTAGWKQGTSLEGRALKSTVERLFAGEPRRGVQCAQCPASCCFSVMRAS